MKAVMRSSGERARPPAPRRARRRTAARRRRRRRPARGPCWGSSGTGCPCDTPAVSAISRIPSRRTPRRPIRPRAAVRIRSSVGPKELAGRAAERHRGVGVLQRYRHRPDILDTFCSFVSCHGLRSGTPLATCWKCDRPGLGRRPRSRRGLRPAQSSGPPPDASIVATAGTTNSTTRATSPISVASCPRWFGRRRPVGQRHVVARGDDHHEVRRHAPRAVGPAGMPVGEVGHLDQHRRPHP